MVVGLAAIPKGRSVPAYDALSKVTAKQRLRFNADMKAKYQALVAAGKPAKVAIVTVMRKLIILANSLLKANRVWTEKTA